MKGQVYSVELLDENDWGISQPGQFVYDEDKSSKTLVGFISSAEYKTMRVCLFEPMELPEKAYDIIQSLNRCDIITLAQNALERNPDMKREWEELLND